MSELPRMNPRYLVLHRKERVPYHSPNGVLIVDEDSDEEIAAETADLAGTWRPTSETHYLHGGRHPTLFTTLKMATKAARDGYTYITKEDRAAFDAARGVKRPLGKIVLFDVDLLPEVMTPDVVLEVPGFADKLSELEFCERQMQLWADRAARIASGK